MTDKEEQSKEKSSKDKKIQSIKDKVNIEFEPSIRDLWAGMDEEFEDLMNGNETSLMEALTVSGRIKRRQQVRRYKSRMQIARRRSMKRRASNATIKRRAQRSALNSVKRRYAGGRPMSQLTYADRARVEKLAARRKGLVARRARRLVITKRALDRNRLANRARR